VARGVPGFVGFVLQVTGVAPAGLMGLVDPDLQATTGSARWTAYAINLYFFTVALVHVPTTLATSAGMPVPSPLRLRCGQSSSGSSIPYAMVAASLASVIFIDAWRSWA
jgi:hypothetical protein